MDEIKTIMVSLSMDSNNNNQSMTVTRKEQRSDRNTFCKHWHHCGRRGAATPFWGWHPKEKNLWLNLQRIMDKRGRTGTNAAGRHPPGGDTRVKWIKATVMTKKGRQFFRTYLIADRWWWIKKVASFFQEKKGWHRQLPPRVTWTLVAPLSENIFSQFTHKHVQENAKKATPEKQMAAFPVRI